MHRYLTMSSIARSEMALWIDLATMHSPAQGVATEPSATTPYAIVYSLDAVLQVFLRSSRSLTCCGQDPRKTFGGRWSQKRRSARCGRQTFSRCVSTPLSCLRSRGCGCCSYQWFAKRCDAFGVAIQGRRHHALLEEETIILVSVILEATGGRLRI